MTAPARIAYDVGCIAMQVIQWWQEKHPTIREIRIGYSYWGNPSVSMHWTGTDGQAHDYYVDCVVIGGRNALEGGVVRLFEQELARFPVEVPRAG